MSDEKKFTVDGVELVKGESYGVYIDNGRPNGVYVVSTEPNMKQRKTIMALNEQQIELLWNELEEEFPYISRLCISSDNSGCLTIDEIMAIQTLTPPYNRNWRCYFNTAATVIMLLLLEAGEQIYWEEEIRIFNAGYYGLIQAGD